MRVVCLALALVVAGTAALAAEPAQGWQFAAGAIVGGVVGALAALTAVRVAARHAEKLEVEPGSYEAGMVKLGVLGFGILAFPVGVAIGAPLGTMGAAWLQGATGNVGLCWLGGLGGAALGFGLGWQAVEVVPYIPLLLPPLAAAAGATLGYNYGK